MISEGGESELSSQRSESSQASELENNAKVYEQMQD
jgi:hypothetical protein